MVSNAERVHETAETLRQRYQADILSLQVDVTDEAQVQSLYEQAAARFGAIDVSIQKRGGDHHRLLRSHAKSRL